MFQIKVTNNDNSEKVLSFKEFTRKVVLAKYGQLISEGEIKDFQLVWMSVVTARIESIKKKRIENMYQVQVHNRQTGEVIMESEIFSTLAEADEMLSRIGSGEGYYSIVYKLDAVWSDLVPA